MHQDSNREGVLSATEIHIDGKTLVGMSSPAHTLESPKRTRGSSPPLSSSNSNKRLSASQLGTDKPSLTPQQPAASNSMPGNRASAKSTRIMKKGWGVLRSAVLGSGDKVQQLKDRLAIEQALDEAAEAGTDAARGKRAGRVPRSPKVFNVINSALEVGQASLKTGGSVPSSPPRSAGTSSHPTSPTKKKDELSPPAKKKNSFKTLPPPASANGVMLGLLQRGLVKRVEKGQHIEDHHHQVAELGVVPPPVGVAHGGD